MSCCPTNKTAVTSNYKSKTLPVYDTGCYKSKTCILYVPDIFGFTPQAKQVCDILGDSTGFRVFAIDFFDGKAWKLEDFPPKEGQDLMGWIKSYDYERDIKRHVVELIEKLKFQGVESFYGIGNCWGAQMVLKMHRDDLVTRVVTYHPSLLSDDVDTVIKAPQCHLLSKDEAPLLGIKAALEASEFASQSIFERFDTMHHGWMAARGDWDNEENRKETQRGLDITVKFFKQ